MKTLCKNCGKPYNIINDECPNYEHYAISINKGWICPKCDRVLAPWMAECHYCNSPELVTNYSTTGMWPPG